MQDRDNSTDKAQDGAELSLQGAQDFDPEVDHLLKELQAHLDGLDSQPRGKRRWPDLVYRRREQRAEREAQQTNAVPVHAKRSESEAERWGRVEAEMAKRDRELDYLRRKQEREQKARDDERPRPDHDFEAAFEELLAEAESGELAPPSEGGSLESSRSSTLICRERPSEIASQVCVPEPRETHSDGDHTATRTITSDEAEAEKKEEGEHEASLSKPEHMRWTKDAFRAHRTLLEIRPWARKLSKRVFGATWEATSGIVSAEKFPFLPKSITASKRGCNAFREEWELLHHVHPERKILVATPTMVSMPAWNKLPAAKKRFSELSEIVTGARFASIAFRGEISPSDWAHALPGSDVLCMSLDLHGEAAHRFLEGEHGNVGKSLQRRLLRRLDHRGQLGEMTVGAIWTKPSSCAVRVFVMFQKDDSGAAYDVELEDRNLRFWTSLQRHKVPVSPDGMPLIVRVDDLAPYLGLSVEELRDRWDVTNAYGGDVAEIDEYTPEDGFPSPKLLAQRRELSYRKWCHFTARLGLPAWISPNFMRLVKDYFFLPEDHVRERQRLVAAKKKRKFVRHGFTKADRLALDRMQMMEFSLDDICIFRCSPAQFAAIAVRDGLVLGEYFDSTHKAGRSKDLYEAIRRDWTTT